MWPLVAAGNSQLPDGQITIDAAMFFIASMLMIAEAWNSYKSKDAVIASKSSQVE
jgi:hypothetical protein